METLQEDVKDILQSLHFVKWDRYTFSKQGLGQFARWDIYGWIDREKDSYKDFVVVTVEEFGGDGYYVRYITSSAKETERIGRILEIDSPHNECIRVEKTFTITNCIKL